MLESFGQSHHFMDLSHLLIIIIDTWLHPFLSWFNILGALVEVSGKIPRWDRGHDEEIRLLLQLSLRNEKLRGFQETFDHLHHLFSN